MINTNMILSDEEKEELLVVLKQRYEDHMWRHEDIAWDDIADRIERNPEKLVALHNMEITGGEPDVIDYDPITDQYVYCDCSEETPAGRRNICYDHEALESRKNNKPENSAQNMAEEIGIEILNEDQYRYLQSIDDFDTKTSSWIHTPDKIRRLGGAIYGDKRYNSVFIYHNGAESYFSVRGFRGCLKI